MIKYKQRALPALPKASKAYEGLKHLSGEDMNELTRAAYNVRWMSPESFLENTAFRAIYNGRTGEQLRERFSGIYLSDKQSSAYAQKLESLMREIALLEPSNAEAEEKRKWRHETVGDYYNTENETKALEELLTDELLARHTMQELINAGRVVLSEPYSKEYISVSVRASVWTTYIDAHIEIGGLCYFRKRIYLGSDVNAL